ncbi:MAG: glycosyltransferase family 2 protein [Rhodanobacter sp.]
MVKKKYVAVAALVGTLFASLGVTAFLSYRAIHARGGSLWVFLQSGVLTAVSLYLLLILVLLVARYAVVIVCSFMDHLEAIQRGPATYTEAELNSLPMVSLVVPAYNEGLVIQPAIRSLLQLDYPNYEIIVIDDGSTDDTYEKALAVASESVNISVRVITKRNAGKAEALNTGMSVAEGEFILNMDGDSKLSSNTLKECVRHFKDPRVAAVAGNVKVVNRQNIWSRIQALEYIEGLAMARKAQSYARVVNIIPGPLGMFRKSVLQEVGGYDHRTFAEDCDLTLKLLVNGWHIIYEARAIAWVETPTSLLNLLKQRYRWTRGILQATAKHKWALWHPHQGGVNFYILWYMIFEGIVWPFSNLLSNFFFAYVSMQYGLIVLLFYWWVQLTLLDLIAAMYCCIIEDEDPAIIPYAVLFRLVYINIIDVAKVLATIEEWRGISMTWGKLDREGSL